MDLKLQRQKTILTRLQSPVRQKRNSQSANNSKQHDNNAVSSLLGNENAGGKYYYNSKPGPPSSLAAAMVRSESILRPPLPFRKKLSGSPLLPTDSHTRRRLPSIQRRFSSPLLPRAATGSLKRETTFHRIDASPAPSRPPRAPTRHSVALSPPVPSANSVHAPRLLMDPHSQASAFNTNGDRRKVPPQQRLLKFFKKNLTTAANGATGTQHSQASLSSGVGRRTIVLDAKQDSHRTSEQKHVLHSAQSPLISRYIRIHSCKDLSGTVAAQAQEDRGTTFAGTNSLKKLPTSSAKVRRLASGTEIMPISLERCGVFLLNGGNRDQTMRPQVASATRLSEKFTSYLGKARRCNSAFKLADIPVASANRRVLSPVYGFWKGGNMAQFAHLEHSIVSSRDGFPYQKKLELLRRREQDVLCALERFVTLCKKNQLQASKNARSKLCTIANYESYASLLTSGLKEIQQCNVALLLCLADCSCELQRPIGAAVSSAATAVDSGVSKQQLPLEEQTDTNTTETNVPPQSKQQEGGRRMSCTFLQHGTNNNNNNTSLEHSSASSPLKKEVHSEYLKLLKAEEHLIVKKLSEVCLRVREALFSWPGITIADKAILSSPLFLPSLATGRFLCATDEEKKPQLAQSNNNSISQECFDESKVTNAVVDSSADDAKNSCKKSTQKTGDLKKVIKGSKSIVSTDDSSRPSQSDVVSADLDEFFPYVGVAMSDVGDAGGNDDGRKKLQEPIADYPRLVLGGGKRSCAFRPVLLKPQTGARAATRKSDLLAKKKFLVGKVSMEKTAFVRTKSKNRVLGKTGESTATSSDLLQVAQIREAEGIWEAIKDLTATHEAPDTSSMSLNRNKLNYTEECILQVEKKAAKTLAQTEISPTFVDFKQEEKKEKKEKVLADDLVKKCGESVEEVKMAVEITPRRTTNTQQQKQKQQKKKKELSLKPPLPLPSPPSSKLLIREGVSSGSSVKHVKGKVIAVVIRIQCCWRRYLARQVVKKKRELANEKRIREQEWQYKTVMAYRLQRLFSRIVARRKWRERINSQGGLFEKSFDQKGERHNTCQLTLQEQIGGGLKKKQKNNMNTTHNDGGELTSPIITAKQTFVRPLQETLTARSQHKDFMKQEVGSSTANDNNNKNSNSNKNIPLLDLKMNGISAFDVVNFQPDPDNFLIGVLHRLLCVPKPLLYIMRVMCDACPPEPESALAFLMMGDDMKSKSQSFQSYEIKEDLQLTEMDVDLVVDEEEEQEGGGGGGHYDDSFKGCKSVSPTIFSEKKLFETTTKRRKNKEQNEDVGEELMLCPCRAVNRYIFSKRLSVTNKSTDINLVRPLTVRVESFVEEDELRHEEPVGKPFQRPFESWGVAYAFQRRAFCAAAIYAWKLIFSHTPHDDYKQRMLQTREEQEARLERVHQRNRMILACYCVRSEEEWLQEASKDLGFVGRIWNPKKSLDPNDPDFERHCRETYEFVEDFLYQCFPTVARLEDIPTFLTGASVFFLLKSVLSYSVDEEKDDDDEDIDEDEGCIGGVTASVRVSRGRSEKKKSLNIVDIQQGKELPLTRRQQQILFTSEVLNFLDYLARSSDYYNEVKNVNPDATRWSNNSDMEIYDCSGRGEEEEVVTPKGGEQYEVETSLVSGDNISPSSGNFLSEKDINMRRENVLRVRLVQLSRGSCKDDVRREKEHNGINGVRKSGALDNVQLGIVYPRGYLVTLSERLTRALFGVNMNLEVCEDLDAMM